MTRAPSRSTVRAYFIFSSPRPTARARRCVAHLNCSLILRAGTFSVTSSVELPDDSCNLAWTLTTKIPDYVTVVRPDTPSFGPIFGRVDVSNARTAGTLAQVSEYLASRGLSFATYRSATDGDNFTATATLTSANEVNIEWLENEFAELGEKLDVDVSFTKLD